MGRLSPAVAGTKLSNCGMSLPAQSCALAKGILDLFTASHSVAMGRLALGVVRIYVTGHGRCPPPMGCVDVLCMPGGEVFTTPGEVNGTFVIDGVVGDYLCAKFGDLKTNPLTIQVKANRVIAAHSANKELKDDFWAYTHTDENSNRVGEFAIGTNIELKDVIGEILQDEKYPGVHIAFGSPYGAHTGAQWYSSTHIDVVGRKFDIWVDDEQIMKHGKFLIEP